MARASAPLAVLDPAAEAHRVAHRRRAGTPTRCRPQPRIGVLDLAALADLLREHAVLVADAVAERRNAERGHRVEEAGREPPQASVAERRIRLVVGDLLEPLGMGLQGLPDLALELECRQRIAEGAPHQEFHRQVVDPPHLLGALVRVGAHPALRKALARHLRHRVQQIDRTRIGRHHADLVEQLGLDARGDAATLGTLRRYQGLVLLHGMKRRRDASWQPGEPPSFLRPPAPRAAQ